MNERRDDGLAAARRLNKYAYLALTLGLFCYVIAIWLQVFIDTHECAAVAPDGFFESHRRWRLRTTQLFLVWSVLGGITLPLGIGWFVLVPAYVWYAYRVLKGMVYLCLGRKPYALRRRWHAAQADRGQRELD